jgi:hypothetical protein
MKRLLAILAALPALLLAPIAALAAENVITLGASVQSTGSQANTGRYYVDAYRPAIDAINAKGGIKVGDFSPNPATARLMVGLPNPNAPHTLAALFLSIAGYA